MNSRSRDNFSKTTKRTLAERVGMRCSNPDCRAATHGPHEDAEKSVNIGVAAHITAASIGGPRYDATLSQQDRISPGNGIWLCQNCAKLIDSDEKEYTEFLLQRWKIGAEHVAKRILGVSQLIGHFEENVASLKLLSVEQYKWLNLIDQQLSIELGILSISNDINNILKERTAILIKELEIIGHKVPPSIVNALADLGNFQAVNNSVDELTLPQLSFWTPMSCLGAIAIFEDIRQRHNLSMIIDFRFPDALSILDYLDCESDNRPDGFLVGIGPTLNPKINSILDEYESICIMPPIQQDVLSVFTNNTKTKVFNEIKTRMHDRYTSLELQMDLVAKSSPQLYGKLESIDLTKALVDLADGNDSSLYALWGLWAKIARDSIDGINHECKSYLSDTVLMMSKETLSRHQGMRQFIKEYIGESWINLKYNRSSRLNTIESLIRTPAFYHQISRYLIYPFQDVRKI